MKADPKLPLRGTTLSCLLVFVVAIAVGYPFGQLTYSLKFRNYGLGVYISNISKFRMNYYLFYKDSKVSLSERKASLSELINEMTSHYEKQEQVMPYRLIRACGFSDSAVCLRMECEAERRKYDKYKK